MTGSVDPMLHRRGLRAELRRARSEARLSQRQVSDELDWSVSKLIRIEGGRVSISRTDLKALLDLYQVTDESTRAEFVRLAQAGRTQPWADYADVLSADFRIFLGHEQSAARLLQYELTVLPGVLQTREYAEAVIRAVARPGTPEETLGRQVDARMARQSILDDPLPTHLCFILDEAVMRRWVAGAPADPHVMRQQLRHLKDLAEHPKISIQVLPLTHGAHFGMHGSFVVLEFPPAADEDLLYTDEDLVYIEGSRGSVLSRDEATEVAFYKATFLDLQRAATRPEELDNVVDRELEMLGSPNNN